MAPQKRWMSPCDFSEGWGLVYTFLHCFFCYIKHTLDLGFGVQWWETWILPICCWRQRGLQPREVTSTPGRSHQQPIPACWPWRSAWQGSCDRGTGYQNKSDSDQGLQVPGVPATVFCHLPASATCVCTIVWFQRHCNRSSQQGFVPAFPLLSYFTGMQAAWIRRRNWWSTEC